MKYSGNNIQHSSLYNTLLNHLSDSIINRYRMAEYLDDNYNSCVLINDKEIEWFDLSFTLRISDDKRMDYFILAQEDDSKFLSSDIVTSRIVNSREQFYKTVFNARSKKFGMIFDKLPENIRQALLNCDLTFINARDGFAFENSSFNLGVQFESITCVLGGAPNKSFVSNIDDENIIDQLIHSLKDFV